MTVGVILKDGRNADGVHRGLCYVLSPSFVIAFVFVTLTLKPFN